MPHSPSPILFRVAALGVLTLLTACASSSRIRAEADVLQAEIERARRSGAMRCAPVELAQAEANLEFAKGELLQGNASRADEHIGSADDAVKSALDRSRSCGPKQVVVRQPKQVVVQIQERDSDGDGIVDNSDSCPSEPEDKDGFEDEDGCPDLDNDRDGVPDTEDECPTTPGVAEERGCPRKYEMVVVSKDRIEIKQQIKFATGSARIVGKDSEAVLNDVGRALKDNPQIERVRIGGHTDSVGADDKNQSLSQKRAESVRAALVKRGIAPTRLEPVGYGETKPIASNDTVEGRAENRRTEFEILTQ